MSMNREQEFQHQLDTLMLRYAELEQRLKAVTEERDIWISNHKALNAGYNELDARWRAVRDELAQYKTTQTDA